MKDEKGVYYHAQPGNVKVRVYVRKNDEIEFRLWAAEHPEVWERHGWVPWSAICQAAELYKKERNPNANPLNLYDCKVAAALLEDSRS